MKIVMIVYVALVLLLSGCAGMQFPVDPSKMTAEQLTAWAKVKEANMGCLVVNSPYGRGVATFVNLDKGSLPVGASVTIDEQCKLSVTGAAPAATVK